MSKFRQKPELQKSKSPLSYLIAMPLQAALTDTGDPVLDAFLSEPAIAKEGRLSDPSPSDYANGVALISSELEISGRRRAIIEVLDELGAEINKKLPESEHVWARFRFARYWFDEVPFAFTREDALFLLNFCAESFPTRYNSSTTRAWLDFCHILDRSNVASHPEFPAVIERIAQTADADPTKHFHEKGKALLEHCFEILERDFTESNFAALYTKCEAFAEECRARCVTRGGRYFQRNLEERTRRKTTSSKKLSAYDGQLADYLDLSPQDAGEFLLDVVRCDTAKRELSLFGKELGVEVGIKRFFPMADLPPMFTNIHLRMETDIQRRELVFTIRQSLELLECAHMYPWRDRFEPNTMRSILKALDASDPASRECVKAFRDAQVGDDLLVRVRKHLIVRHLGETVYPFSLAEAALLNLKFSQRVLTSFSRKR